VLARSLFRLTAGPWQLDFRALVGEACAEHANGLDLQNEVAWRRMASHGVAWRRMASHGVAWRRMASHGVASS
jgi:hypothetical protein